MKVSDDVVLRKRRRLHMGAHLTQDFPDDLLVPLVLAIAQHQYLQARADLVCPLPLRQPSGWQLCWAGPACQATAGGRSGVQTWQHGFLYLERCTLPLSALGLDV